MAIRVIIVDDHAVVRSGLRHVLEAEDDIEVVAEAGDLRERRLRGPRAQARRDPDGRGHAGRERHRGDAGRAQRG